MRKANPSHFTRDPFDLLSDRSPPTTSGGRPRTVDLYAVLNAIFYVRVEEAATQWWQSHQKSRGFAAKLLPASLWL